jgi:hypothetical protein
MGNGFSRCCSGRFGFFLIGCYPLRLPLWFARRLSGLVPGLVLLPVLSVLTPPAQADWSGELLVGLGVIRIPALDRDDGYYPDAEPDAASDHTYVLSNTYRVAVAVPWTSFFSTGLNIGFQRERNNRSRDEEQDYENDWLYRSFDIGWRASFSIPGLNQVGPYVSAGQYCQASGVSSIWFRNGCAPVYAAGWMFKGDSSGTILLEYSTGHFQDLEFHSESVGLKGIF